MERDHEQRIESQRQILHAFLSGSEVKSTMRDYLGEMIQEITHWTGWTVDFWLSRLDLAPQKIQEVREMVEKSVLSTSGPWVIGILEGPVAMKPRTPPKSTDAGM